MTPDTATLDTVVGPGTLEQIQQTLDHMWVAHPEVPESIRTELSIATAEIGANIIEHAAAGQPVPLCMRIRLLPNEVQIDFTDHGSFAAHVDLAVLPAVDELAERGRGLALAQAVLSRLSYRRDDLGNHWSLVSKSFRT